MANLDAFKGTYPYASELFGIYEWRQRDARVNRSA